MTPPIPTPEEENYGPAQCGKCGSHNWHEIEASENLKLQTVRRYECMACGYEWTRIDDTPPLPSVSGEREAFEAWCVSDHGYTSAPKRDGAGYFGAEARLMWNVWQAARTLPTGDRDRGYAEGLTEHEQKQLCGAREWVEACTSPSAAVTIGDLHIGNLLAIIDRLSPQKEP